MWAAKYTNAVMVLCFSKRTQSRSFIEMMNYMYFPITRRSTPIASNVLILVLLIVMRVNHVGIDHVG